MLTIAYNVPLNGRLAAVTTLDARALSFWQEYLTTWTRANTVRAVLSAAGAAAVAVAALAGRTP